MGDLDLNIEKIYYALKYINDSKEKLTELSSVLNNIDISGVELSNASLLGDANTIVKNILNETFVDVGDRLEKTKNVIIESDTDALLLFAYLDGEFNDEFGNFSEEKVNEYIEKSKMNCMRKRLNRLNRNIMKK